MGMFVGALASYRASYCFVVFEETLGGRLIDEETNDETR